MRIKLQMNSGMKALYTELDSDRMTGPTKLSSELLRLVEPGFTVIDGAVLLKSQVKLAKGVKPDNFPDLTGYECFVNHVHIEDYLSDAEPDLNALLTRGLVFANKTSGRAFVVISRPVFQGDCWY